MTKDKGTWGNRFRPVPAAFSEQPTLANSRPKGSRWPRKFTPAAAFALFLLVLCNHQSAEGAVRDWTGGGANNNWTTATNWAGGVAPSAGDDLVFPLGAAGLLNTNNFPAGTAFNSITISGTNYGLAGASIVLSAGVNASNTTVANFFAIPLTLQSNQTITTGNTGGICTFRERLTRAAKTSPSPGTGRPSSRQWLAARED
jgi:hypothetical protein